MGAVMTRNNISSSGWEYLVAWRGFGFESFVCHFWVILIVLLF